MDTDKKIREHISTLCDGELAPADLELALAALQTADGQQAWNTYHRIGDVLRAQATPDLSPDFATRLAARLAAEPAPLRRAARQAGADKRRADAGPAAPARAESAQAAAADGPVAVTAAKPAIVSVS